MLEPEIAAFIEQVNRINPRDKPPRNVTEQRAFYERMAAALTPPLPEGVIAEDAALSAPAGHRIGLRLFRRRDVSAPRATLLFFHGGGFVVGSLDSHQVITAQLAADTGLCVVAVDYRLAPEAPAPAAHDDCLGVTLAALDGRLPFSAAQTGGAPLPTTLLLAGDSAGGNLSVSIAAWLRDHGHADRLSQIKGIALAYPMAAWDPELPASETEAQAPMLTLPGLLVYRQRYWNDVREPAWTIPLDARRYDGLPPVLAIGAEHDPLRDDARVLAERIRAAGGNARFWLGEGLAHGVWRAVHQSPGVRRMHDEVCRFLLDAAG
ncbi:alpha/beta hydrolase fold domain-containing protein [Paraburkholderia phosphatilytica]|uniref:alpha/beta hydrolase fold domain-containing protein n=1 Tax=Paraburkholderia phosphatilytica TaxID=2282883 RepID=UPI000E53B5C1|nr:alpha/beta hydrolase [Paraburkholderia phosphatilytica]